MNSQLNQSRINSILSIIHIFQKGIIFPYKTPLTSNIAFVMIGVKLSQDINSEIKKKLGLHFNANLSFLWGVSFPIPDWYDNLSPLQKSTWYAYRRFGDFVTMLLILSNVMKVTQGYEDISIVIPCSGTIIYIICVQIKLIIFRRNARILEEVLNSIHRISDNLNGNPVRDDQFFELHDSYYRHVKFYGLNKTIAITSGVVMLGVFKMVHGSLQDNPDDRSLPMPGWYPYDAYQLPQFLASCFFQIAAHLAFLQKDVVVDLIFLAILVVLNTHLMYLRILLGKIVAGAKDTTKDKNENMGWWIRQHQLILETIEDFKKISNPYLMAKYISVSLILFIGGVLVTSNVDIDLIQQLVVFAVSCSNLLQLYIFSIMGDAICDNGQKLPEEGMHIELFKDKIHLQKKYLHIVTRCSKPILIRFGDINPLSTYSFGQIVKMTFSYFITIVQIRDQYNNDK